VVVGGVVDPVVVPVVVGGVVVSPPPSAHAAPTRASVMIKASVARTRRPMVVGPPFISAAGIAGF
jgi:hypothetical protein